MRKAAIATFLLLGSTILGATVLREPIASAASPITSVIIANDSSRPVPVRELNVDGNGNIKVHEQGAITVQGTVTANQPATTTALISTQVINSNNPSADVDVSAYREIRLATSGWGCSGGVTADLFISAVESGTVYVIDAIPICVGGSGVDADAMRDALSRAYEIPGRTLRLSLTSTSAGISLAVFGRTN